VNRGGPVGVGIIGAGVISRQYLDSLTAFPDVNVVAIGDLLPDAAHARAVEYGVRVSGEVDAVLNNDAVEIVLNLTIPSAHSEVAQQAIAAGKHVYNEKPIALDRASVEDLLQSADAANLRVGGAPDTFLGAGWQAVRKAVARGDVGEPQTALTLMQQPGPESWHPNPAFLYQPGAGPLFDLGPYYITCLVQLFGAAAYVAASATKSRETRVIRSGPLAGQSFPVVVPTYTSANLSFARGQSATSVYSFDSPLSRILLELTGTEATLAMPDPNTFGGDLLICRRDGEWRTLESTQAVSSRGTGVLDMARALRENRPHRASGVLAAHVLDIMLATVEAAKQHQVVTVESSVDPAELLPDDWDPFVATL
jgi:predicted dehydrogenase